MTVTSAPPDSSLAEQVAALREFSRFYTRKVGALEEGLAGSPWTLTEARVLFELAGRRRATASKLGEELGLDAGYLSRILRRFETGGLLRRVVSEFDGRQLILALTPAGEAAFDALDRGTRERVEAMLRDRPATDRARLAVALREVQSLLGDTVHGETAHGETAHRSEREPEPASLPAPTVPYLLRTHDVGDMGLVVSRQAVLYAREYGWNAEYEALASRIVADFLTGFDQRRERCWIAEREGEMVGSVFLVKHPEREGVARLRLLYVDPSARGLGIGRRLVAECTRFARHAGYATITLWTNSVLVSARRLYEAEGYHLVGENPHRSFGQELTGQTWELAL